MAREIISLFLNVCHAVTGVDGALHAVAAAISPHTAHHGGFTLDVRGTVLARGVALGLVSVALGAAEVILGRVTGTGNGSDALHFILEVLTTPAADLIPVFTVSVIPARSCGIFRTKWELRTAAFYWCNTDVYPFTPGRTAYGSLVTVSVVHALVLLRPLTGQKLCPRTALLTVLYLLWTDANNFTIPLAVEVVFISTLSPVDELHTFALGLVVVPSDN